MKKQLKYKGLTKAEREYLQRESRKDFVEMLIGLIILAAILVGMVALIIGALK